MGEIKAHKNIENHQYLMLLTIAIQIDLVTLHTKIGPYSITYVCKVRLETPIKNNHYAILTTYHFNVVLIILCG